MNELQVVNIEDYAMTPDVIRRQVNLIQEVMAKVMKSGEHYGTIPGCGPKPTLLKPGAEKLSVTFRLAPSYEITKTQLENGHREYEVKCTLTHMGSGVVVGEGVGSCSTMEGKYRFRKTEQTCPKCGEPSIIKGKKEYGGGWLCFAKKGGCGSKFKDGDPAIENQEMGRVEHDNPADYWNTCLKMAKKRAHVDATLTATAASDIFTQDVEDMPEVFANGGPPADHANWNASGKKSTKPPEGTQRRADDIRAEIDGYLNSEWIDAEKRESGKAYLAGNPSLKSMEAFRDRLLSLYGEWKEAKASADQSRVEKPDKPADTPPEKMWRCVVCNSQSKGGSEDATDGWRLVSTQQTGPHMGLCPAHVGETTDSLREQAEAAEAQGKKADAKRYHKAASILADMEASV